MNYHPRTINLYRQPSSRLDRLRADEPDDGKRRLPLTWGDCQDDDEPCPYVSCRYHLFLGIDPSTGSLKLNFPDLFDLDGAPEVEKMPGTCALKVAERGGVTLEAIGELLNVTRERARQLEAAAMEHMRKRLAVIGCTESHLYTPTESVFDGPDTDMD